MRLTEKKRLRLCEYYARGYSMSETARRYSTTEHTVYRWLHRYGYKIRPSGSRKVFTKKRDIKRVISCYKKGVTAQELGEQYGCTKQSVLNLLKRNGVERRKRGQYDRRTAN